jgi:hypothetical protein
MDIEKNHCCRDKCKINKLRCFGCILNIAIFLSIIVMNIHTTDIDIGTAEMDDYYALFILMCFSLFPIIITIFLQLRLLHIMSQRLLCFSTIYYGTFFYYQYFYFATYPDAQACFWSLLLGIYSLPIFFPLWIISIYLSRPQLPDDSV